MAATVMGGFLDRLRVQIDPTDDSRPDAQLLAAFHDRHDRRAFTVLVRRYGPLVWAVCRRCAGNCHAAEDAFQATFLVLARKAGSVRPRHSVGGWLHRTAVHVAWKARAMTLRRTRRESLRSLLPETIVPDPPEPTDPAALVALDEEIAQLPDGLRAAVVLCELQGTPRREAADRLGIAEGTLSSRLAAARKTLADRLRRRGVSPVVGITGLLAASGSAGAAPPGLVVAATTLGTGGRPPVPAAVSILADGVIQTMFLKSLSLAAAGAVVLLALVAGLWPGARPSASAAAGWTPVANTAPVPKLATREGVLVVTSFQPAPSAEVFTPDGTKIRTLTVGAAATSINPGNPPVCPLWRPRLSPDGKWLVAVKLGPLGPNQGSWTANHLWAFELDSDTGPTQPLLPDLRNPFAVWSPDGTKLYGSSIDPEKIFDPIPKVGLVPLVCWTLDMKTKVRTPLALPPGHQVVDISADGRTLMTVLEASPFAVPADETYLVPLATLKPRRLTEKLFSGMRFSPDGARVIGVRREEKNGWKRRVVIVAVADGSETAVRVGGDDDDLTCACWSPDGRRIAVGDKTQVIICDLDGRNAKVIVNRKPDEEFKGMDWR